MRGNYLNLMLPQLFVTPKIVLHFVYHDVTSYVVAAARVSEVGAAEPAAGTRLVICFTGRYRTFFS